MPHLVETNNGYDHVLSCELGQTSDRAFGYEALMADDPQAQYQLLCRLRQAVQHLHYSENPDVQIVASQIDDRYSVDTSGAPNDFEFACQPGESITTKLAGISNEGLLRFVQWNYERQGLIRQTIIQHLPLHQEDATKRAKLLYKSGIIPKSGYNHLRWSIEDIVRRQEIFAIDSFDGSYALGMTNNNGIHISHLFNGGYTIGNPNDYFLPVGFHEECHVIRRNNIWSRGRVPIIDEMLAEHHTVISTPDKSYLRADVLTASETGLYQSERRLIGMNLIDSEPVGADMIGEALVKPASEIAYQGVLKVVRRNFNLIFPQHDGEAFETFCEEYESCTFGHQAERVVRKWCDEADMKLYGVLTLVDQSR